MNYFHEKVFYDLRDMSVDYLSQNYDFCYLKAMHNIIEKECFDVLVAGCSHSMNGIVESELTRKTINLSIASQDLYYDLKHIEKVFSSFIPQYTVINIGYWALYQDLSKQKNQGILCDTVYHPLFNDSHLKDVSIYKPKEFISQHFNQLNTYFPKDTLLDIATQWSINCLENERSYYNSIQSRENCSALYLNNIIWQNISSDERISIAKTRAYAHNKFIKYHNTLIENKKILFSIIKSICNMGSIPVFVIFPQSQEYLQFIDNRFKEEIFQSLNEIEYPIYLFDMNETHIFDINDFIDSDHLNIHGAMKASCLLDQYLDSIG